MEYFLIIFSVLMYIFSAERCWQAAIREQSKRSLGAMSALIAIGLHGYTLYWLIDVHGGHNLTAINLLSQATWFAACAAWLAAWSRLFSPLSVAVYLLAAVNVGVLLVAPQTQDVVNYESSVILHVLLSLVIVSIYLLSGLQAILIVLQQYMMKSHAKSWLRYEWPSIENMETYLFQLIKYGFIGLTALIILSLWKLPFQFWLQSQAKLVFVLGAWLASLGLLVGRRYYGWRGSVAVKWTWFGLVFVFSALLLASMK